MESSDMENKRKEYKEFQDKVKKTVCVGNLNPKANEEALRKAFEQYGNVGEIKFIPTYNEFLSFPDTNSKYALVVMEDEKQAKDIIDTLNDFPFVICGMPRPVTAAPAVAEMFPNRPQRPDAARIECQWIDKTHPDFQAAQAKKKLFVKHSIELEALNDFQLHREEKLHKKQEDILRAEMKKYNTLEKVVDEKSVSKLAHAYNVDLFKY